MPLPPCLDPDDFAISARYLLRCPHDLNTVANPSHLEVLSTVNHRENQKKDIVALSTVLQTNVLVAKMSAPTTTDVPKVEMLSLFSRRCLSLY